MRFIVDSSAWIEYLEGSKKGEKVDKILTGDNEILILNLNISEVVSKVKRKGGNAELAYEAMISKAKIFEITPKISKEAGLLHAEIKPNNKNFSLADAIIIKTAESASAKILTGDSHFNKFKGAVIL